MAQAIIPSEFIDVRARVKQLNLTLPDSIVVLPGNLDNASNPSDLLYASSTSSILKLFRINKHINAAAITEEPVPIRRDHDYTIVLPILFFGAAYLSQNPHAISIALNIVSNYATQMLQGIPSDGKIKLTVAIETKKTMTVKKLEYNGPLSGLDEVAKIAKTIYGK